MAARDEVRGPTGTGVRYGARSTRLTLGSQALESVTLALTYTLLAVGAVFVLLPFVFMVSTSLKQPGQVFQFPPVWMPKPVVWSNYREALTVLPFARFFANSAIITGTGIIGGLISSSLVAYSFARLRWPGRDVLFLVVLSTMMLPYHVTMIPRFVIFRQLGWVNTFLPLIVPSFFGGPFLIFLLRQFFMAISLELDDAARLDGCTFFQIYWRIILPLSRPALATVAIFLFRQRWTDFIGPLIYLNDIEKFTVEVGLRLFQGMYFTDWHLMMAVATVAMLPMLVMFYFGQQYFVQGIVFTGVKG